MTTSDHAPHQPARSAARHSWWMLGADSVLILLFAALGNRTHLSGLGAGEILATAAPFLTAWLLVGTALRTWRRPSRIWPDGVLIVVVTVTLGMVLRVATGLGGAPTSFVLVTTGVLSLFLLGRRLLTGRLLPETRPTRRSAEA